MRGDKRISAAVVQGALHMDYSRPTTQHKHMTFGLTGIPYLITIESMLTVASLSPGLQLGINGSLRHHTLRVDDFFYVMLPTGDLHFFHTLNKWL